MAQRILHSAAAGAVTRAGLSGGLLPAARGRVRFRRLRGASTSRSTNEVCWAAETTASALTSRPLVTSAAGRAVPALSAVSDRRGVKALDDPVGPDIIVAGIAILAVSILILWTPFSDALLALVRERPLTGVLTTYSTAMAVVAAGLEFVRWRVIGDAGGYWIAVALLVLGVFAIALGESFGTSPPAPAGPALMWIRPASMIVVLALFAKALHGEHRDENVRPLLTLLSAAGAVTALAVLFQLLPPLNSMTLAGESAASSRLAATLSYGAVGTSWSTVAGMSLWRGFRLRNDVLTWAGLVAFGLTFTELLYAASEISGQEWQLGAQMVRAVTLSFGVAGATRGLQRIFASRSDNLLRSTVEAQSAEARIAAHRALAEEQAHEARNALMAIEGATTTLERYRHRLDAETRERLARAVTGEIERLQRLVRQRSPDPYHIAFELAEVVDQQLVLARAQGMHILADVRGDLRVLGRPADVAEVLQNLLTNARRHAVHSPVAVRAVEHGEYVDLRVEDRGPGVDPDHRDAIFDRGARRSRGAGSGLGLYVSTRLMADQGGKLGLEDRPGGGAAFIMSLRRVTS